MAQIIFWNSYNNGIATVRPPGPHILANWLMLHGFTAKVIDFCNLLSTDELLNITEKHIDSSTVAIGVSGTFWKSTEIVSIKHNTEQSYQDKNNARSTEPNWVINGRTQIETKYPRLKWLLGGNGDLSTNQFDWIKIFNHAEDSLIKFLEENVSKINNYKPFDIVNYGGCFHYHDDLSIQKDEVLSIELSRGCQFKCKFCAYPLIGKKVGTYIRDMKLVEKELILNYEKWGTTKYSFVDDTVNESTKKIEELAEIASRLPFKLEWIGYNRMDLIYANPHTIELLKASGLKSTFFGIESFHLDASKCIGKGWSGKHGKEFILRLKEEWGNNITMHLGFIVGLPYEPIFSIENTHQWCIDNNIDFWSYSPLVINREKSLSIFDKEAHVYGIKFPHPLKPTYWEHEHCNFESAMDLSKKINFDPVKMDISKVETWLLSLYCSLGYSMNELMLLNIKDLYNYCNAYHRQIEFKEKYVKSQLF